MAGLKFHWHILCLYFTLLGICNCAGAPSSVNRQGAGNNNLSMNLQFKQDDKDDVNIPVELEGLRKRRGFWGDTAMYAAAPVVFSVTLFVLKLVVDKIKARSNKQAQLERQQANEAYKARNTQILENIGDEIRDLDRIPLWGPGEDEKALDLTMQLDRLSTEFGEIGSEVLSSLALGLVTRLTDVMTSKQAASIVGMEAEANPSRSVEEGTGEDVENDDTVPEAKAEEFVEAEEAVGEESAQEEAIREESAQEEVVGEESAQEEAAPEVVSEIVSEVGPEDSVQDDPVREEVESQDVPNGIVDAQGKAESHSAEQDSAEDSDMPNKDDREALLEAIKTYSSKGRDAALNAFNSP